MKTLLLLLLSSLSYSEIKDVDTLNLPYNLFYDLYMNCETHITYVDAPVTGWYGGNGFVYQKFPGGYTIVEGVLPTDYAIKKYTCSSPVPQKVTMSWTTPEFNEDGSALNPNNIARYELAYTKNGVPDNQSFPAGTNSVTIEGFFPGVDLAYVVVVTYDNQHSAVNPVTITID